MSVLFINYYCALMNYLCVFALILNYPYVFFQVSSLLQLDAITLELSIV